MYVYKRTTFVNVQITKSHKGGNASMHISTCCCFIQTSTTKSCNYHLRKILDCPILYCKVLHNRHPRLLRETLISNKVIGTHRAGTYLNLMRTTSKRMTRLTSWILETKNSVYMVHFYLVVVVSQRL